MTYTPYQILFGYSNNYNEMGETCGMYVETRNACRCLVRKSEDMRQFGRPGRGCRCYIKILSISHK
jgi:hypothetical protein